MKKPKLLLIIPLLIISILPVLPAAIPRAHALTGLVCLTDTSTTGCPSSPPTLFAAQGSQLMVQVQITGSDNLNGFNIQISTDNTVLQAADASLTGSIIGSGATVVLKCLDGTLVTGPACDSTDGPGVLHFAAVKLGATVAGSGLLFTAVYNVVSKTPGINVSLLSVTISNGTSTPDSENTQGATFSNLTDFGVTASPASISTPPSTTGTSTITFTSFGGFNDFITITVSPSAGLTASTADAGVFLPPDGTASTTLSVSSATSGSYSVDVTGTGSNPAFTHTVHVPVTITPPGFTVVASPTSLSLAPGNFGTSMITVTSVATFTGTVTLTASAPGLTATLSPTSIVLGTSGTSTLTVTAAMGTTPGSYTVTVTGTSGTITKSATVMVDVGVPDFSLTALPDTITVFRSGPFTTAASTLNLASINNFAATLSITGTISFAFISTPGSSSLPFTLSPSVTLAAAGTATDSLIATVTRSTAGTGLYVASITAVGGGKTHTVAVNIWVIDFTVTPQDTVIKMINQPGTIGQDPVSIAAIGAPYNDTGFNINPGFTEGTAQFPVAYYSNSATGLKIDSALGLDTSGTSRRCFLEVFDSSNNLIMPTISSGVVTGFAGPLVHLNGDQFGFPAAFNGCRLDSFWYVDPANGNTLGATEDTAFVTVEPLTTTPNGIFTALVCLAAGGDINCVSITIIMVAPPAPPALSQFTGRTATVSLAAGGQGNFKVGVTSQDPTTTVYVSVTVTAVSLDGTITVTGTSGVVAIPAGGRVNNIPVSLDFSGVAAGTTFNENLVVSYGVAPHYLTLTSSQTIGSPGKLTGSVIVTP